MRRAGRIAAAIAWCVLCGATRLAAQTPSPEGWVVLPVDEYRALRERSLGIGPPPALPPVDATLSRVDYELRVDGESIAGRVVLTVDVLREGWARVAIPAGLMVRDARIDGRPVALVEDAAPHLLLSRSGRTAVTLDLVVPLGASAGTESITLPASAAPITRAAFVLPRSGVDLSLSGGFVAEHVESADESRWTIFGRPNEALLLSWKRRVDDRRTTLPLRFRARMTEFVGLGEDGSQVSASVRVEVVQGLAQDIALALPAGLVVNEVNGPTVGDWQAVDGTLRVRLLEPVSSEVSFVVQGETRAPRDGTIAIPIVRVPAAERESGGIAVDVLGAGEIAERQARGLEPADPSELGDIVAARESPSMIAFRLRPLSGGDPRGLTVTVVRYTPQAVLVANVEEARYRALAAEDGRLLVEARYAIRNNQRSFLKVSLPANATVWSAEVAGQPIRPGVAEDNAVLLPLDKGRAGQDAPTFVVELVYLQRIGAWPEKGRSSLELPALDLPTSRTGFRLYYSPRYKIDLLPGAFRAEYDAGPFAAALRRDNMAPPTARAVDAFSPASAGLQTLVDRFRNEAGERTVVGSLPVNVMFPDFGPSMFLASELTAEARAPSVEFAIKRTRP
jgi:hypothetical protein